MSAEDTPGTGAERAAEDPSAERGATFATTRWTRVLAAREETAEAREALSELCGAYYGPVVTFLRREGRTEDAARELAHAFFARVLERRSLRGADPARGRFRSYLLGALKHFLVNHRVHEQRDKRGGVSTAMPLSGDHEAALDDLPGGGGSGPSEALFDREWALVMLARGFAVIAADARRRGALKEYEILKPWLTGEAADRSVADAARTLGITDGAVHVAIHRLRRRFRQAIRAEIAHTVPSPGDVADELRHLIAALTVA